MKKIFYFLMIAMFPFIAGCDTNALESLANDSSYEADLEEARMALNDGNYDKVLKILEPRYNPSIPDPKAARILASAYMGKAGIDLTYLIENSGSSLEGDSFDTIASALSLEITDQRLRALDAAAGEADEGSVRYIAFDSVKDFLINLEIAREYLNALIGYYADKGLTGEEDDIVQLGMASAVHFILQIGEAAASVTGYNVPLNKHAYREAFPMDGDYAALLDDLADYLDTDRPDILATLKNDIYHVAGAVEVLNRIMGSDEDIAKEFNDFLEDLLGDEHSYDDLTGGMIVDYIEAHLLGYIG